MRPCSSLPCSGGAPAQQPVGPAPMGLDRPQPRRQYAVLLQDESQSATQSFGGSGIHRQGLALLHARRMPPPTAGGSVSDAGAGASATGPPTAGADGGSPPLAWQPLHARHISGHKHRLEEPAAAPPKAAKSGGRNGSDSGSNSPGGGSSPVPDSQQQLGDAPPPTKLQRSMRSKQ